MGGRLAMPIFRLILWLPRLYGANGPSFAESLACRVGVRSGSTTVRLRVPRGLGTATADSLRSSLRLGIARLRRGAGLPAVARRGIQRRHAGDATGRVATAGSLRSPLGSGRPAFAEGLACRVEVRSLIRCRGVDAAQRPGATAGSLRSSLGSERRLVGPVGFEPTTKRL